MRLILTPEQTATLTRELVETAPERLVHLVGRAVTEQSYAVIEMIPDLEADRSWSHCRPSAKGQQAVQRLERDGVGSYIGIVHSHPRHAPEPSGPDADAAADTLGLNDHLNHFFVGVVTDASEAHPPTHRTGLGRGQISMHVLSSDNGSHLQPARITTGREANFLLDLHRRIPTPLLSAVLGSRVLIVGAGSVGSTMAKVLTRNGVGAIHLLDPDTVEGINLSRTTYTTQDLGNSKVNALADRLRAINPMLTVTTSDAPLDEASIQAVGEALKSADLVIAATDDPHAQAMLDHLLQLHDKPGMFVGVVAGGHMGEIVLVLPGVTTCYRCAAGSNRLQSARQAMDYSTGRVMGALALGADVTAVGVLAAKTALELLGLLLGTDRSLEPILLESRSMIQIGLSPETFGSYEAFRGTPNQHSIQSLWLNPQPRDDCEFCEHIPPTRPLVAQEQEPAALPARHQVRRERSGAVGPVRHRARP